MCPNISYFIWTAILKEGRTFRYTNSHLRLGKGSHETARCADLFESSMSDRAWNKLKSHEVALMYKKVLSTRETKVIICHLVTSPFKSMYYKCITRFLAKISCRKTIEATMMKKQKNKWKQIDIRNKHFYCSFLVSVDFFFWQSFKHTDKLKMSFFRWR